MRRKIINFFGCNTTLVDFAFYTHTGGKSGQSYRDDLHTHFSYHSFRYQQLSIYNMSFYAETILYNNAYDRYTRSAVNLFSIKSFLKINP